MASDSSTSTTPLVLTPDSTGGVAMSTTSESSPIKKSRRQTAFYPNMNPGSKPLKPFSRSAAKRESVLALGSIEHLQHYFTKTGIMSKKNHMDKKHRGLVPAIGGMSMVPQTVSLDSVEEDIPLPPPISPTPDRVAYPPFVKTYETDPDSLLPGVVDDLNAVTRAWSIDVTLGKSDKKPGLLGPGIVASSAGFDVLDVLKTTTRAIRSIRNYLFYLPDESVGTIRAQFRPKGLNPNVPQQTSSTSLQIQSQPPPDPLTLIRKAALEVLTVLRELEEKSRLPLSDEAYDAQSDGIGSQGGSRSRFTSPNGGTQDLPPEYPEGSHGPPSNVGSQDIDPEMSFSFSLVQVQGRYESVPVWEDDDDDDFNNGDSDEEKREPWDERLVLGSGWLYKQDIRLDDLQKERNAVSTYLDAVDEVLFGGRTTGEQQERGWERERKKKAGKTASKLKSRRVSAGDGEGRSMNTFLGVPDTSKRRVSTGMVETMRNMSLTEEPESMEGIREDEEGEESVDEEDLPEWARRSAFTNDELRRAHAILSYFLPPYLLPVLSPPTSRESFLASLSSGQLLCVAYNSCVRKSGNAWGYVTKDAIHDIIALEQAAGSDSGGEGGKKGWTFRRIDNLRLWVGALRIRYLLPIQNPSQPMKQSSTSNNNNTDNPIRKIEPPIFFDPKIVARKEDGWQDMLEAVLLRWIKSIVEERRSQH